jgi:hypothetical protein
MTETSLHDLIENSIDSGPEPRLSAADAAAAGRRVLRQRRGSLAARLSTGGLMVALAVSFGAMTFGDGHSPRETQKTHLATPPVVDHSTAPITTVKAGAGPVIQTSVGPVRFDAATGRITPPRGWKVVERRDGVAGPGSTAMSITNGSKTYYIVHFAPGSEPVAIFGFPAGVPFSQWLDALEPEFKSMQTGQGGE